MAAPPELRVGAFVLEGLLGRGGTSDVWRARHESGAVAAVKVLRAQLAEDGSVAEALRNEVEAVARLEHPSIALVLELGAVLDDEAARSEGTFAAGTPWLALELASGGTLSGLQATTWSALRDTLSVLLGALAHAHARGFIHRDLKPANVLVCAAHDARPGLKLTDFGLARAPALKAPGEDGLLAGTPAYMSPEQFRLDDAALGPWSDLYALGCVAFALATGRPPFEGSWRTLLKAHLHGERPPVPPLPGAPPALSAWIHRLLAQDPIARFPSAADARAALHALDDSAAPDPRQVPPGLLPQAGASTSPPCATPPVQSLSVEEPTEGFRGDDGLAAAPTRMRTSAKVPSPAHEGLTSASQALPSSLARPSTVAASTVRLPSSWRVRWRDDASAVRSTLVGAGLGLYGLREVPVSGRERERDALWQALVEVERARRPRGVVLRGGAGTGKSRLAAWLGQRAHEIGGVLTLRAEHHATLPSTEALARMVARHLGIAADADRDEAAEHARRWAAHRQLRGDDVTAVVALLPSEGMEGAAAAPEERYERLRCLLAALTHDRPVIVWLDDVQWGDDSLRFVGRLLERDVPALYVLTVRDEALTEPSVTDALRALEGRPEVTRLDVGPLDEHAHRELVADLLHLAPELAAHVAERTAGNPLFAVQLVGDWVQRRLLVLGPRGFELAPGADVRVPDALHEVWSSHIARLVASFERGAREALELAAVLGQRVALVEWRAACRLLLEDTSLLPSLLGAMVRARLAERRADGSWSFGHGALRESLERGAREGGRLEDLHRVVATALTGVYGAGALGVSDRVGVHLVRARAYADALEPLAFSAREHCARGEWLEVTRLLALHDEAVRALGLSSEDPRRAEPLLLRARASVERGGRLDAALSASHEVQKRRSLPGWRGHQAEAWLLRAYVSYRSAKLDDAARAYRAARTSARSSGDVAAELRALLGLGDVEYYAGARRSAGRRYREALPLADGSGDVRLTVRCLWSLGYVEMWAGKLPRARRLFERQLELCRRESDAIGVARALASLSEVHRLSGALDVAERLMREAIVPFERAGAVRSVAIGRLNLLSIEVARGRLESARQDLLRHLPELQALDEPPYVAMCHAMLVACAIAAREEAAAGEHLDEVERILGRQPYVEGDLADALERAGMYALDRGADQLAERALTFARDQWQKVGRDEHADDIGRRLERLVQKGRG